MLTAQQMQQMQMQQQQQMQMQQQQQQQQKQIPALPSACLSRLLRLSSVPEQLFIDTSAKTALLTAKLYQCYLDGDHVVLDAFSPVVVAALLKKWLFHMRAPLVPARYAELYISMAQLSKPLERLQALKKSLRLLPRANFIMLERLACLFHLVAEAGTGPTAEELAAIFALVLLWPPSSAADAASAADDEPAEKKAPGADLLLTASIPSLQMSSKIRLSPSITAAEALELIFKKVRRLDSELPYRIWLPPPKNICAEPDAVLQQFNLRDGDTLIIKQSGTPVPPYYHAAAADLWLAIIEEYRFLFANGNARFIAEVHRVPVARESDPRATVVGGGFRRRAVITADMFDVELETALQQADENGGGGGGAVLPARDRSARAAAPLPAAASAAAAAPSPTVPRLVSAPSVGFSQLSPGRGSGVDIDSDSFYPVVNVQTQPEAVIDEQDFLDLKLAFGGLEDDVLREALQQCGTLRAATEFLQSQSDEADAQRMLYSTLELKDVKQRPAPPLPKGATPQPSGSPVGNLSSSSGSVIPAVEPLMRGSGPLSTSHSANAIVLPHTVPRARPVLPEKPSFLSKNASMSSVESSSSAARAAPAALQRSLSPGATQSSSPGVPQRSLSPGATPTASPGVPQRSLSPGATPQRPELGLNASKPDLFKEIAFLNSEVRRLTQLNRELVAGVDETAAIRALQTQVGDLTAHLEEIKERCTCGAARYRAVK